MQNERKICFKMHSYPHSFRCRTGKWTKTKSERTPLLFVKPSKKKQLSTRRWIHLRKKRDIQYLEFIILNLLAPDWLAGSQKHNAYYRNRFLEINILNQRNSEEIFTEMDSIVHSKLIIYYTTLTRNNRDNVYTNLIFILCKHLVQQARTLFP